jgi:superfamily II DNA or RNA helicase
MPTNSNASPFPVRFTGRLRPAQEAAIKIARAQLAKGKRRVHIVAPPGSGKTVLGLYLWSECVQEPAVVLSPNSAIQAQWASRTNLFQVSPEASDGVSMDPKTPGLLTSLTYQSVTLPDRGDADMDEAATALWKETLIAKGQAEDPDEATVWIEDLRRHNREYYEQRLSAYRKMVRDRVALSGNSLATLHASSLETLHRLRDRGVGLVILDECHHLMSHWGRVLADARELLEQPVVIGLTATPPDRVGKLPEDVERYDEFFGPVDYEVPVPAVVKDGFLAPYQDLAYFVRPTSEELQYLATVDSEFHEVVHLLCGEFGRNRPRSRGGNSSQAEPPGSAGGNPAGSTSGAASLDFSQHVSDEPLPVWLERVLRTLELPTGRMKDWTSFERRDPELARMGPLFLMSRGTPLPAHVPSPDETIIDPQAQQFDLLVPLLDRYIRHRLQRSEDPADHALAERAIAKLRLLGIQVTETGPRACASPVGRVMAYSTAKTRALLPILEAEMKALGDTIRAVVIADYEKTSAVAPEIGHLLDEEAGGAVAAFRGLLSTPEVDGLDPVLVTGSTVLVDDDLAEQFKKEADRWLAEHRHSSELTYQEEAGFHVLTGSGSQWCPRVYVEMITDLFQRGVTRCLVGTRGLLGEGWDANKVNVLVNLASVTTSMSVNQLRGRSIRLDPDVPEKMADNWDVVCIAPEFAKGLDDYRRFIDRHKTIYGLADDGAIEKGVGHVHAAFTELKPEGLEGSLHVLNDDMLDRVHRRAEFRKLWRIGEPYHSDPIHTLEIHDVGENAGGGFPPFKQGKQAWTGSSLSLAVGHAVLGALLEAKLLKKRYRLQVADRAGGYVRLFLERAAAEDGALFAEAVREALAPLDQPRYVIPRYADEVTDTWVSHLLPELFARYFRRRERQMAMLHAVPSALAKKKERADVFARHWNRHVSPGEALYAHRGPGQELLEKARRKRQVPTSVARDKEVFM